MNEYLKQSARVVLGLFVMLVALVLLGRLVDSSLLRWSPAQLAVVGWWVVTAIVAWWLGAVSARLWLSLSPEASVPISTRFIFAVPWWFILATLFLWFGLIPV